MYPAAVRKGALSSGLSLAVATALAISASPAAASITLGQVPATTPPLVCSNVKDDWVQPSVSSGNSYAASVAGTITSWSTFAAVNSGQVWTFKVFRPAPAPPTYKVVAVDGPHPLVSGVFNDFGTRIPVEPGDLIGMNDNDTTTPASTACTVVSPGNTIYWGGGSASLGSTATLATPVADRWLNLSAVLQPTNTFSVGGVARDRKRGTATLTVTVPNPGQLTVAGIGIAASSPVTAGTPGDYQLSIAATSRKLRKLRKLGKVKVKARVTYTPTGGEARIRGQKVILRKKLSAARS
jgi:hypothetical protein